MKHMMMCAAWLLLASMLLLSTACAPTPDTEALWEDALYDSYTTLGEGANTVCVTVSAGERSVTLVLRTDKTNLGEAMYELGLVNDPVFFDTCNGMTVDYDTYHAYWEFRVNGSIAMHGIGDAPVPSTDTYLLVLVQQ